MENKIQELNLELLKTVQFNFCDGKTIAAALIENRNLWKAVIMDRPHDGNYVDLIRLRDISTGRWNVDTLFILSSNKDDCKLEELAGGWNADSIEWIEDDKAENRLGGSDDEHARILQIWWD